MNTLRFNPTKWVPNLSEQAQDPTALLRADNLVFDEPGVIKTGRGTVRVSSGPFGSAPHSLFSQSLLGSVVGSTDPTIKVRYVGSGTTVYRNWAGGTPNESDYSAAILTGGDAAYAAFGNAWGHTFIFSGTKKRADNGDASAARDLGLAAPSAPTIARNTPPSISIFNTWAPWSPSPEWEAPEGAYSCNTSNEWIKVDVDATTFRGVLRAPYYGVVDTIDSTNFGSTGQDTPNDIFSMGVRVDDTSSIIKVRIEVILETESSPGTGAQDVKNYYWFEWYNDSKLTETPDYLTADVFDYTDRAEFIERARQQLEPGINLVSFFREGQDFWGTLQCTRSQFKRSGTDASKSWATIKGIRIIVEAADTNSLMVANPQFIGGENGQLNGYYSYIQVEVNETGEYTEVGISSPGSSELQVINGSVRVTPAAVSGSANKIKIYRSSTQTPGYFLVKELTTPYAAFDDVMSDVDAVRYGEQLEIYRTALPDGIQSVIIPYYDRAIYFDYNTMYVSYRYDPGSYDARHVFKICGTNSEVILWTAKVIDGVLYVGTTNDVYEISGDFAYDEATGLLNVSVRGLGIKQPPVSDSVCIWSNNLIYLAEDGWRTLAGSQTGTIIDDINLLYQAQDRHGVGYVNIGSRSAHYNQAVVSHNKLYCSVSDSIDGRSLHSYNFATKQWSYWRNCVNGNNTPQSMYVEEDGTILFSTGSGGDLYLYTFDTPTTKNTLGEGGNNTFYLLTTFFCNGEPHNRKDPFTLKVKADTGGENITITVNAFTDENTYTLNFSEYFDGVKEKFFDISSGLQVPKFFQVAISGTVEDFRLFSIAIVYDSRPTELNYLALQPESFGSDSRKRITVVPIEIDTRGNEVIFTPILDGVSQTPVSITTQQKQVYLYQFEADKIVRTVGGYFYCQYGVFEFYRLLPSQEMEVLPEAVKFKYVPLNHLGTSKRKRISQIAFIINTNGNPVTFSPSVDGVYYSSYQYTTSQRSLQIYTFTSEVTGYEIGGVFQGGSEFEFYGLELNESVYEVLPPVTKFYRLAPTNYGSASKKRIRTLAFVIDTKGSNVTFTPDVDGVSQSAATFNTNGKRTVLYYFDTDVFGIDYGGTFSGSNDFEFYQALPPFNVEELPIGRKFDQIGPLDFNRQAKVKWVRLTLMATGTELTYEIFSNDVSLTSNSVTTVANKEQSIEIPMPYGVNVELFRMTFASDEVFHRMKVEVKLSITGNSTDQKWVTL